MAPYISRHNRYTDRELQGIRFDERSRLRLLEDVLVRIHELATGMYLNESEEDLRREIGRYAEAAFRKLGPRFVHYRIATLKQRSE